jgi:hypothetical protein
VRYFGGRSIVRDGHLRIAAAYLPRLRHCTWHFRTCFFGARCYRRRFHGQSVFRSDGVLVWRYLGSGAHGPDLDLCRWGDLAWRVNDNLALSPGDDRTWELAAAEGIAVERARLLFTLLLAMVIAIAMKIVGILLIISMLIIPAAAARSLTRTPERMAMMAI